MVQKQNHRYLKPVTSTLTRSISLHQIGNKCLLWEGPCIKNVNSCCLVEARGSGSHCRQNTFFLPVRKIYCLFANTQFEVLIGDIFWTVRCIQQKFTKFYLLAFITPSETRPEARFSSAYMLVLRSYSSNYPDAELFFIYTTAWELKLRLTSLTFHGSLPMPTESWKVPIKFNKLCILACVEKLQLDSLAYLNLWTSDTMHLSNKFQTYNATKTVLLLFFKHPNACYCFLGLLNFRYRDQTYRCTGRTETFNSMILDMVRVWLGVSAAL